MPLSIQTHSYSLVFAMLQTALFNAETEGPHTNLYSIERNSRFPRLTYGGIIYGAMSKGNIVYPNSRKVSSSWPRGPIYNMRNDDGAIFYFTPQIMLYRDIFKRFCEAGTNDNPSAPITSTLMEILSSVLYVRHLERGISKNRSSLQCGIAKKLLVTLGLVLSKATSSPSRVARANS